MADAPSFDPGGSFQVEGTPSFDPSQPFNTGASSSSQPPQTTSQLLGFYKGIMHPLDRAAEAAPFVVNSIFPHVGDAITSLGNLAGLPSAQEAQQAHEAYVHGQQAKGTQPGGVGNFAGQVVATLPLAEMGPLSGGAVTGYLGGDSKTAGGTVADMLEGAIGAKVGEKVLGGLASVISPHLSPAVQMLKDMGVTLTPGQIMGGFGKRLEDAATSIPFIGDAIQGAQRRSVVSFNKAMINNSIQPIGALLPKDMPAGHDAVAYAGDQLSGAYNRLLPSLNISADHTFASDINTARQGLTSLPADKLAQFDNVMGNDVLGRFTMTPAGQTTATATIGGQDIKNMESRLGQLARSYSSSALADDRALGSAYGDVRDGLRDLITRQNPQAADELAKINKGYALLTRIEGAAGKANPVPGAYDQQGGVFTPQQLMTAVRQADTTMRKRGMARGTALMQGQAEAAKSVLPSSVPDSGTARRMLTNGGLLGVGGGLLHLLEPGTLAAVLGTAAGYSPLGTRAIQTLLTERPSLAAPLASILSTTLRRPAMTAGAVAGANAGRSQSAAPQQ